MIHSLKSNFTFVLYFSALLVFAYLGALLYFSLNKKSHFLWQIDVSCRPTLSNHNVQIKNAQYLSISLGAGSFGGVYAALDLRDEKPVAIKKLRKKF